MSKYRMYIDEVGDASMQGDASSTNRYLSLTGVIIDLNYVDTVLAPDLEALKRQFFKTHVDEPLILHRKQLANRVYPFKELMNPTIEQQFNTRLLHLLTVWDYKTITVVIDKYRHKEQYKVWQYDPYHYCLLILVERFVSLLERIDGTNIQGDVLAEARGGKEDRRLKDSFERVYDKGSDYVAVDRIQKRLTSRQLKVKTKSNNIAGLQLADLLAHPSFKAVQARFHNKSLPENFGGQIAAILEQEKYDRSPTGKIDGFGRKWLP